MKQKLKTNIKAYQQHLQKINKIYFNLSIVASVLLWSCSESNNQAQSGAQTQADSQSQTSADSSATGPGTSAQDTEDGGDETGGDGVAGCEGAEPCAVNMVIGTQRFECTLTQSEATRRVWECVEEASGEESEWICTLEGESTEGASWICESRDTDGLLLGWKCSDPKRMEGNGETNWECDPDQTCVPDVSPSIGEWTPAYVFHGESCNECSHDISHFADCRHLFVGRVDAVNGNKANLSFEKTMNGGPPSVVIRWWILAVPMANPTCQPFENLALADLDVRAEGYWTPDERILFVQDVPIWPTQETFEVALPGDQVHLFLITGGRDGPELPTWITKDALSFTKAEECE